MKIDTTVAAVISMANFLFFEHPVPPSAPQGCAGTPTASLVVNVKDMGASGEGRADDTVPLQAAIDKMAGTGGTVFVPDGTYMVNVVGKKRLALRSNMTLKLSDGATLKAIPNDSARYSVLAVLGISNVTVVGGTLEGERKQHTGKSGEWGKGIYIGRGAKRITISDLTSKNMWGDGFYVRGASDVKFCLVTAENNRRQGLSIIEADGVEVTHSIFKGTRGSRPSAGIDLEPDKATQKIANVRIRNSKFLDNAGAGIELAGKKGRISKVEIKCNLFGGNRPTGVKGAHTAHDSMICLNQHVSLFRMASWFFDLDENGCESLDTSASEACR